jgi:hypothetical protein
MLNRAGRRALLKPLRLERRTAILSYHPFTHTLSPRTTRPVLQLSKLYPSRCRSFTTTTQTPTGKLRTAINQARHDHPFLFPTLLIASVASTSWLFILIYDEYTRKEPEIGVFPPAVERHLRNAIWYTEIKPEPDIAAKSFMKALEQAERAGMDPFSPEFTGIHIRFAAALEKFGQAKGAVEVLGRLVDDVIERTEDIDRGRVTQHGAQSMQANNIVAQRSDAGSIGQTSPDSLGNERCRLLKLAIECKVKISQLYASDYIQDNASAARVQDEAMKILIESMRDPKSLQFDENRAGVSADEAAAMLSAAGGSNMMWGNHGIALEIFKLALIAVRKANKGKPSCREAFTLSNMSAAVSQMLDTPNPIIDDKPATHASLKQARHVLAGLARQSLQCAGAVQASEQDEFCNMAVVASWSHLANTLMELGDLKVSREMWESVLQGSAVHPELRMLVPIAEGALKEIEERGKSGS